MNSPFHLRSHECFLKSDLCECALLTEQTNARSDGLLPGESKVKYIPAIRRQCADCLQVGHANYPDSYVQIILCKLSHVLDNGHTSTHIQSLFMCLLHSKPLRPSTQTNKSLPFIKVIEIKSWTLPQPHHITAMTTAPSSNISAGEF